MASPVLAEAWMVCMYGIPFSQRARAVATHSLVTALFLCANPHVVRPCPSCVRVSLLLEDAVNFAREPLHTALLPVLQVFGLQPLSLC
jgi:hypothetical protein